MPNYSERKIISEPWERDHLHSQNKSSKDWKAASSPVCCVLKKKTRNKKKKNGLQPLWVEFNVDFLSLPEVQS